MLWWSDARRADEAAFTGFRRVIFGNGRVHRIQERLNNLVLWLAL